MTREPSAAMAALGTSGGLVLRNTASRLTSSLLAQGAKALAAVLVGRVHGPRGLGLFMLVWTVTSVLAQLAPLGLHTLAVREMNRPVVRVDVRSAMPLVLAAGGALALLTAIVPLLAGLPASQSRAFAAGALYVLAGAPVQLLHAAFNARERMGLQTAADTVEGALALALVAGTLLAGFDIPAALLGLAAARGANLAVSLALLRRLPPLTPAQRRAPDRWAAALRAALPIAAASVLHQVVRRADIVLLGVLAGAEQVGVYSAAAVIVLVAPDAATELNRALYPALSRASGLTDPRLAALFRRTWRLLAVGSLCAAAGLTVLAGDVLDLVYGEAFGEAAIVLALLAWVLPPQVAGDLAGVTLNGTGHQGRRARAMAAGAGFNLAANLALIPLLGVAGAAVATVATDTLVLLLLRRALSPLRAPVLRALMEGGLVAGAVAAVALLVPGPVLARAGAGLVCFAVLAWRLGLLTERRTFSPEATT